MKEIVLLNSNQKLFWSTGDNDISWIKKISILVENVYLKSTLRHLTVMMHCFIT